MRNKFIFLFFILFVAVAAFGQPGARQIYPDKMSINGTVEMPLNVRGHLPVIEAKVNGKGPFRFELDTGFGGMVQLKESVVTQLKMPVIGEAMSGDPSGRNPVTVRLLRAESVDVGSARFEGVIVSETKRERAPDLDGVIGLSLFDKLKVRMDYGGNKFALTEGSIPQASGLSYSAEQGVPEIEINVNGTKAKVHIDSGSPGEVTLPLSMAKSLPLKAEPVVVGRGRTADGEFEVYGAELKGEVNAGGVVLKDPRLDFISVFPLGNLGSRFLRKLSVTFDPANKLLMFQKADAANEPDLSKSASGKRALSYFTAFNSGEDAQLTAFFAENIDAEALKRRPVEPRVAFHKQVRDDFKKLSVKRVVAVNDEEIKVLAQSPLGTWASITFEIEGGAGKFAGVMVEKMDAPKEGENARPKAPTTLAELGPAIDALVTDLVKKDQFSGVVMVAKDDKPIYSKAWGMADADKKAANKIDTRFNLGSINKMFTRVAIGQLVSQGKLSFSDKLIKVLPDYPNRAVAEKITIGQMITMSSGLGDFFNAKFDAVDKSKIRSQKDYLQFFVNDPLEFEPGTDRRYSNAGYLILGLVIEKLSGKTYYDYVREYVFKPAGMTNTDSYAMDELPANTAIGYASPTPGKLTPNVSEQPARGSSAGGGYSTAEDMLRFANALRTKKLSIPGDDGTFPSDFKGTGIAGGSPGVNAIFITNAATGYTVIVLSNFDPPSAETPGTTVRDWLKQLKQ